jgi:hypothetical protein
MFCCFNSAKATKVSNKAKRMQKAKPGSAATAGDPILFWAKRSFCRGTIVMHLSRVLKSAQP